MSIAMAVYEALLTDNQASFDLYGREVLAIREDGKLLELNVESINGATGFNREQKAWKAVVLPTLNAFAGV